VVAAVDEKLAQVAADKAGAARDEDAVALDARLGLDERGAAAVAVLLFVFFMCGGGGWRGERNGRAGGRGVGGGRPRVAFFALFCNRASMYRSVLHAFACGAVA